LQARRSLTWNRSLANATSFLTPASSSRFFGSPLSELLCPGSGPLPGASTGGSLPPGASAAEPRSLPSRRTSTSRCRSLLRSRPVRVQVPAPCVPLRAPFAAGFKRPVSIPERRSVSEKVQRAEARFRNQIPQRPRIRFDVCCQAPAP